MRMIWIAHIKTNNFDALLDLSGATFSLAGGLSKLNHVVELVGPKDSKAKVEVTRNRICMEF
jgi:hypothetical protein